MKKKTKLTVCPAAIYVPAFRPSGSPRPVSRFSFSLTSPLCRFHAPSSYRCSATRDEHHARSTPYGKTRTQSHTVIHNRTRTRSTRTRGWGRWDGSHNSRLHTKSTDETRVKKATRQLDEFCTKRLLSLTTRQTWSGFANRLVRSRSSARYVSPAMRRYSLTGKIPFRFYIVWPHTRSCVYDETVVTILPFAFSTGSVFIAASGR